MSAIVAFIGRVLIALLFIVSGAFKIGDPMGMAGLFKNFGLPANSGLFLGFFEVVAGLFLALGIMSRLISFLLAAFVLVTIFIAHNPMVDPGELTAALKNAAIAGGLLLVFAYGQMRWSYDHMRTKRKGELATAKADQRAHEAELRAARAEGRVEGASPAAVGTEPVAGRPVARSRILGSNGDSRPD